MYPQQAIDFAYDSAHTFDAFWAGDNAVLLELLRKFAAGEGEDRQIFLSGISGAGKTHLLSAACAQATTLGARIAYLPADVVVDATAVDGLATFDLVCIDDLHRLPATRSSELALFTLINALREYQGRLLLAADRPAASLPTELPDLTTRLRWGAQFDVSPVAAEQLASVLGMRAEHMGLELGDDVLEFLLNRCPRRLSSLIETLRYIDQASLQAKRRITVPFVREALQDSVFQVPEN
ncbi:MAG: DnaA regulatory inactivator Hda [Gammaproteobacteria bacterium]|nr:DnaA regulatory inactivator Hda [Gammaproteobacteria bacterium]